MILRQDALLQQLVAAHHGLRRYSSQYQVIQQLGEQSRELRAGSLAFERPGSARIDVGSPGGLVQAYAVTDGKTRWMVFEKTKTYWKLPAEPNGSAIFQTLERIANFDYLVLALASGRAAYGGDVQNVRPGADETVEKVACSTLTLVSGSRAGRPTEIALAIGKDDHLLRRLRVPLQEVPGATLNYVFSDVRTDGVPATRYTPDLAGLKEMPPSVEYDAAMLPGAPAPLLLANDRSGKTIDLETLRGKVVVVHFWATHTPRSLWSLPDLVAAQRRFAGRPDVRFIGICGNARSQQREVDAALKSAGVTWPQVFDGLGWDSGPIKVWGLDELPFIAVVGRNGKLASVNSGGPDIAAAVERALRAR